MTHRSPPAHTSLPASASPRWQRSAGSALIGLLCATGLAWAEDAPADKPKAIDKIVLPAKPEPQDTGGKLSMAQQVREAIDKANAGNPAGSAKKGKPAKAKAAEIPKLMLTIEAEPKKPGLAGAPAAPPDIAAAHAKAHGLLNPVDSKAASRAAATAGPTTLAQREAPAGHAEVHWDYDGANGPQAWAKLNPEFNLCAQGQRQSPIDIQESSTLQGPAEPLQIRYQPSGAMVLNNGHTIQVDVVGDNTLTVRSSVYKLVQLNFHHPSEERVNGKASAMVAHLVHRNADGQLAVLAVLLDPGQANTLINKVWTYMPLDSGDRVRMPAGLLDLSELLPQDMRYYQFMGSLTTPPCSEGVLWVVLKQPVQISTEQLRLFGQLFPFNARPVQPLNGRVVRDAQ